MCTTSLLHSRWWSIHQVDIDPVGFHIPVLLVLLLFAFYFFFFAF